MIIKQLREGMMANFSYIIGCQETREALVIDPADEVNRIIEEAKKESLNIKYILNTHNHFDHTAGNNQIKLLTGAKVIMHKSDVDKHQLVDIQLDQEKVIKIGDLTLNVIHTPGHTPGGICIYIEGHLFTGDTLFVGDSGRTDLPGGNRSSLGASIRKLMQLPDDTIVWPGHDYGPSPSSTIGWEKKHNINAVEYGFYIGDNR